MAFKCFSAIAHFLVTTRWITTSAKEAMQLWLFVVCLSVCLLATLHKNFWIDLHEIFRQGWQWASEQMIKFWSRLGSRMRILIRIQIATLVTRALAEVCTVPVILVFFRITVHPLIWNNWVGIVKMRLHSTIAMLCYVIAACILQICLTSTACNADGLL